MKITRLELLKIPPSWVWLKIHTDAGLVGLGEPYLENHPDSVIAEVRRLEPLLLGRDPLRIEELWRAMYDGGIGYKGGPVTMSYLDAHAGFMRFTVTVAGMALGNRLVVAEMQGRTQRFLESLPLRPIEPLVATSVSEARTSIGAVADRMAAGSTNAVVARVTMPTSPCPSPTPPTAPTIGTEEMALRPPRRNAGPSSGTGPTSSAAFPPIHAPSAMPARIAPMMPV